MICVCGSSAHTKSFTCSQQNCRNCQFLIQFWSLAFCINQHWIINSGYALHSSTCVVEAFTPKMSFTTKTSRCENHMNGINMKRHYLHSQWASPTRANICMLCHFATVPSITSRPQQMRRANRLTSNSLKPFLFNKLNHIWFALMMDLHCTWYTHNISPLVFQKSNSFEMDWKWR